MKDKRDIQPPAHPQDPPSDTHQASTTHQLMNNSEGQDGACSPDSDSVIPFYEELHALPSVDATSMEVIAAYANCLQGAPGFPWQPTEEGLSATPTLAAPYLTGVASEIVTPEDLIAGIFINVPRSPKLWTGDQLRMHWGNNTFYTTIEEPKVRTGPRLVQHLNTERLCNYENGEINVRYEVVRRTRLIGVSETLKIVLLGSKNRPKTAGRARSNRRRKLLP